MKFFAHLMMFSLGMLCILYLMNLTFGFEPLQDNLPLIGNLDELGVSAILLSVLSYFGLDTTVVGRGLRSWVDGKKRLAGSKAGEETRGLPER